LKLYWQPYLDAEVTMDETLDRHVRQV
jgi:hypothetical protein